MPLSFWEWLQINPSALHIYLENRGRIGFLSAKEEKYALEGYLIVPVPLCSNCPCLFLLNLALEPSDVLTVT